MRYARRRQKRQPPKRTTFPLPPPSEDRQMEDFLGCCEYSDAQFDANRNSNLLNYDAFTSPVVLWYSGSQRKEFERQRAIYTSHCICQQRDQENEEKKEDSTMEANEVNALNAEGNSGGQLGAAETGSSGKGEAEINGDMHKTVAEPKDVDVQQTVEYLVNITSEFAKEEYDEAVKNTVFGLVSSCISTVSYQ